MIAFAVTSSVLHSLELFMLEATPAVRGFELLYKSDLIVMNNIGCW